MDKQWTTFPGFNGNLTVILKQQKYLNNGRLAVEVVSTENGTEESYAIVTRNFSDAPLSGPDCSFFDANNYGYILEWMLNEGICVPTGNCVESGFCVYPEVKFDIDTLVQADLE